MRRQALLSALALWLCTGALNAQTTEHPLKAALDKLFDAPLWSNAHWGVKVMNLDTSQVLYEREADKGFMPASNLKLYTTAAALDTLGPDFRFETRICANGPVTRGGTLRGDIVVVGSGDPSISGRYVNTHLTTSTRQVAQDQPTTAILRQWAKAIRAKGIRRVEGAVIGADSFFDDSPRCSTWQLDYYPEWYAAETSALAINENCWDVTVTPGKRVGAPAQITPLFSTRYVTFRNEILTTGPRGKSQEDPPINISRPLDANEVILTGYMPVDMPEYKMWGSIHNGTLYCATLLKEELERQGVSVSGGARDEDDLPQAWAARLRPERLKVLYTHVSAPLSRILAIVNKPSQNFYAEQLMKTLGKRFYGVGDYDHGELVVKDLLTSAGVDNTGLRMADGSGLSRQNLVEPRMTVALLAYMSKRPHFQAFFESLPIAGVDGTLKSRLRGTEGAGNVHAKTGYIGRVRALSGYTKNKDNQRIAFCMMANNYLAETKQANETQDSACLLLVNDCAATSETQTAAK